MNDVTSIDFEKFQRYQKDHDEYGHYVGFSDDILGPASMKGILMRWLSNICEEIFYAMSKYHLPRALNIDAGDKQFVEARFNIAYSKIQHIVPVLESMTNEKLIGIVDIAEAIYGYDSDEVYLIKKFLKLSSEMDEWDCEHMWKLSATDDHRLYHILHHVQVFTTPNKYKHLYF